MPEFKWVKSSVNESIPSGLSPVFVSRDKDGSPIFVGRVIHEGEYMAAKIVPARGECYIPYGGREISKEHFEYLSGPPEEFSWRSAANGKIPLGAIPTGTTNYNMALYIGRVKHKGVLTPGKVHSDHGCIYISFHQKEHKYKDYEVLVWNQNAAQVEDAKSKGLTANVNNNLTFSPTFKLI